MTYEMAIKIVSNLEITPKEKFIFILIVHKENAHLDFEQQFYQYFLTEITALNTALQAQPPSS